MKDDSSKDANAESAAVHARVISDTVEHSKFGSIFCLQWRKGIQKEERELGQRRPKKRKALMRKLWGGGKLWFNFQTRHTVDRPARNLLNSVVSRRNQKLRIRENSCAEIYRNRIKI